MVESQKLIVVMLLLGLLALPGYFFKRRIGGRGGGSDKEIVGVLWFLGSIALAFLMYTGR